MTDSSCVFDVVRSLQPEAAGTRVALTRGMTGTLSRRDPGYAENLDCCQFSCQHRSPVGVWLDADNHILDVAHAFRTPVLGYRDHPDDAGLLEVWFEGPQAPEVLA